MNGIVKMEADVIVVAGGMSGLCASVAAAEKGASVIVFEKSRTVGGAANMGMGFFAVESHIQKRQLDSLTLNQAYNMLMEHNHWKSDGLLIRKLYKQSASTVKWIEDMGVEFLGAYRYFKDSQATWHIPKIAGSNKPTERCASVIVKALLDRAEELGVKFVFNTAVTGITRNGKRVSGVTAKDENGTVINADSDAVIVCTGGFGDNPEMIKEYMGYEHGKNLFSFRIPGLKGEGMKMVWEIGGGRSPVGIEMTYESPAYAGGGLSEIVMRQPNLLVNLDGKRFMNEEVMINTPYTGNAIMRQRNARGISIISESVIQDYRNTGLDYFFYHKVAHNVDEWDTTIDHYLKNNADDDPMAKIFGTLFGTGNSLSKLFFIADSIEELAEQLGIDAKTLNETIAEYNKACDCGVDDMFGKPSRYLRPIRGNKFYAMIFVPSGYGSLGGIKINDMLQVVTDEGDTIPGLYAAGTDTCCIFGDTYNFYLPGSTMGYAINSGRASGYNAVDYIDSELFVED